MASMHSTASKLSSSKGQRPSAIDEGEGSPIGKPAGRGSNLGMSNPSGLAIYAIKRTSGALDECQRRPSRTATDIENAAVPIDSKKIGNFNLLGLGAPTLLPNIFAKDLAP